ncbi:unnamed protein product [Rhizophagus irregularis]|uniref:Uncharacterized protein n=1 Tax=Rhizophagus irregularis TaxID=588596 RepID=A0A915Z1U9_9GLOM|nr:unnamed protein product [Rhizophagus irregularis]CAB5184134.1 unnamed protein product [Rhizophagus irregularis]CAB5199747.1 unnamed protein product [Rhizophagus irregularis]CAB5358255.1 unnamed protein product [Rhizophagus irregularis]
MIQKFQRNATIRERRAWIRLCAYCCGTIVQEELDWILHDVVALFFRFRLDETYLLDVILLYTVGSFRSAKIIFAQKLPRSVDTSRPFSFL